MTNDDKMRRLLRHYDFLIQQAVERRVAAHVSMSQWDWATVRAVAEENRAEINGMLSEPPSPEPDLALVIESRNALPGLLDEIERLRADLREAVALLRTDSVNGDTFFAWRDRRDALLAKHKEEA